MLALKEVTQLQLEGCPQADSRQTTIGYIFYNLLSDENKKNEI